MKELIARIKYDACCILFKDGSWDMGAHLAGSLFPLGGYWVNRHGKFSTYAESQRAGLKHTITEIALALESCNNCVATDLPEVEPDESSWRIDNTGALRRLKTLAQRLEVSTDSDP